MDKWRKSAAQAGRGTKEVTPRGFFKASGAVVTGVSEASIAFSEPY
jgi:hypothetical protein